MRTLLDFEVSRLRNDTNSKREQSDDCKLTMGDIVGFLETRTNANIGIFAALVAVAAGVAFSLVDIVRQGSIQSLSLWILVLGCVLLVVIYLLGRKFFGHPLADALKARQIVKDIMKGDIRSPNEAMRRWQSEKKLKDLMKNSTDEGRISNEESGKAQRNQRAGRSAQILEVGVNDLTSVPQEAGDYLGDANECYIHGIYRGSILLSVAALEIALKVKFGLEGKKLHFLIEEASNRGFFDGGDVEKADRLRQMRNEYVHLLTDRIVERTMRDGREFKMQYVTFTERRVIPESQPEVVSVPRDCLEELMFTMTYLNPKDVLEFIIDSHRLVRRLFPRQTP